MEIIQLNENSQQFEKKISFSHTYPPTKLMFIPDMVRKTFVNLLEFFIERELAGTVGHLRWIFKDLAVARGLEICWVAQWPDKPEWVFSAFDFIWLELWEFVFDWDFEHWYDVHYLGYWEKRGVYAADCTW